MKRITVLVIAALAVLSWSSLASAQGLDLLTGRIGDGPICALTPVGATAVFGIPSRNQREPDRLVMEFSHHGVVLQFPSAGVPAEPRLAAVTVYAAGRDGFMGHRGHFLGTVAKGTRSEPVRRLLRSARAEIASDEPELLRARLSGFELEIGFVADLIDYATLTCLAAPARREGVG